MKKIHKNKIENKRVNSELKDLSDKMYRIFCEIERKQECILCFLSRTLQFSKPVFYEERHELKRNTQIFNNLLKRLKEITD